MLSKSQSSMLKHIADRPPLSAHLGSALSAHRVLTVGERNAPLPVVLNDTPASYRDVLRANLLKRKAAVASALMRPAVAGAVGDAKGFLTGEALILEDADLLERLGKSKISPSLVMALHGCLASFAVKRYAWAFELESASVEMKRGQAFHEVFERLMALPADVRTLDVAKSFTGEVLGKPDYDLIRALPDQVDWLYETVGNAFTFRRADGSVESPQDTELYVMPDGKPALEVPVSGAIGGATRETFGIIDRITVNDDGSPVIQDYKTASKMKRYSPSIVKRSGAHAGERIPRLPEKIVNPDGTESWRIPDGFKEAHQQYSYLILAEQNGIDVKDAELLFPAVHDSYNVAPVPALITSVEDPEPEVVAFDKWVRDSYKAADEAVDKLSTTGVFPYSPSFLCSWCPLAKLCPQFQAHTGKGAAVAAGQPDFIPHLTPLHSN